MTAVFSPCRRWRYRLERDVATLASARGAVAFVGLNPSVAAEEKNDPTIRREMNFARDWGFRRLVKGNAYGLVSTDPRGLWTVDDPVGPDNDAHLEAIARDVELVVCAWGVHAKPDRVAAVLAAIAAEGDRSATAALLYLLLGCRATEVTDRVARDLDARATVLVIDEGKTDAAARRLAIPTVLRPLVKGLLVRDGRKLKPGEYLFDRGDGEAPTRFWALYHVKRICDLAKVPKVCTHSLRGLQSTLATAAHATGELVAAQLGQTGPAVTRRHYLAAGIEQSARGDRAAATLTDGMRGEQIWPTQFPAPENATGSVAAEPAN